MPVNRSGFAVVDRQNDQGLQQVQYQATTANAGVHVDHVALGSYQMQFHGLGKDALGNNLPLGTVVEGVVHVRAREDLAYCAPSGFAFAQSGDVRVTVDCVDIVAPHAKRDAIFTVNYTNGSTDEGGLSVARVNGSATGSSIAFERSSVAGTITSTRTATGKYTVDMPLLNTGKAPAFAVTATKLFGPVCVIDAPSSVVSGKRRALVHCFDPATQQDLDSSFNISYAEGANLLGAVSQFSAAYLSVPVISDFNVEHTPSAQYNRIDDGFAAGTHTVTRMTDGRYRVKLANQGAAHNGAPLASAAIATAVGTLVRCQVEGSSRGASTIPGVFDEVLTVHCFSNGPVAFDLQLAGSTPPACAKLTHNTDTTLPDLATVLSFSLTPNCVGLSSFTTKIEVHIVHTYRGDLSIELITPGLPGGPSTVHRLKDQNLSDGTDNVDAIFTVDASDAPRAGVWQIRIQDHFQGDSGFIDSWSVTA
ncbi:hypothetical protein Rhe02_52480 [Rhizocola hellebori]|uniref:P/Homo B domain-containing protein n=1 Tax=Rhizocola hellebori TaxID=1392758 RepID=A0A8J3VIL4_9ACTN|nr:hypothetical protein Rhe02_52480 [Rhizocola hellebori]